MTFKVIGCQLSWINYITYILDLVSLLGLRYAKKEVGLKKLSGAVIHDRLFTIIHVHEKSA